MSRSINRDSPTRNISPNSTIKPLDCCNRSIFEYCCHLKKLLTLCHVCRGITFGSSKSCPTPKNTFFYLLYVAIFIRSLYCIRTVTWSLATHFLINMTFLIWWLNAYSNGPLTDCTKVPRHHGLKKTRFIFVFEF